MSLDGLTLMAAGSMVSGIGALLLFGAWTQMRRFSTLLLWAIGGLLGSLGIATIAVGVGGNAKPLIGIGVLLAAASPALVWAGARRFEGRKVSLGPAGLTLPAGSLAMAAIAAGDAPAMATAAAFFSTIWFLSASTVELWRGRADGLPARFAILALFLIHAIIHTGGLWEVLTGAFSIDAVPGVESWFGAIYFEGLFYSMGTAIFMIILCKERIEAHHIEAAFRDELTGVANRRALFESAGRMMDRSSRSGGPLSLILFDLDRFKSINDTYGHRAGDRVLAEFAETCRRTLRPNDFIGRYGGEEFVVVLPGTSVAAAYVIAERTRHAFAEARTMHDGRHVPATVSAGVAAAVAGQTFDDLLESADTALYRAKNNGRNNVQIADDGGDGGNDTNVIRVA